MAVDANAQLIAAAPEMLGALKRVERELVHLLDMNGPSGITGRDPSTDDPTLEIVRAAISKATGGA
jgi:hypothetical protein